MTSHNTQTNDAGLQNIFHSRLHKLFSLRPELVRTGRGCNSDFRKRFDLHYSTATPILEGKVLPGLPLAMRIAGEFGCSLGWLMGFEQAGKERDSVSIKLIDQEGEISIPNQHMKNVSSGSNLVAARSPVSSKPEDIVIIQPTPELEDRMVHYCYSPATKTGGLFKVIKLDEFNYELENLIGGFRRRVNIETTPVGQTEKLVHFSIIGPVVAQIYWDLQ